MSAINNKDINNAFSGRLKKLRADRGLTQAVVAAGTGVAPSSIVNYEKAEKLPSSDVLARLCQFFCVSADYLLGLSDSIHHKDSWPPALPNGAVEAVEKIKKATEKMISSGRFSQYDLKAMKFYAQIFELVGTIDDIVDREVINLKKSFPDFVSFGHWDSVQINGQHLREALIKSDPKALEYVKAYDDALHEIQREIYEISLHVGRLILDISPVVTCGGISSTPANSKEPSDEEIQSFYESVNEK